MATTTIGAPTTIPTSNPTAETTAQAAQSAPLVQATPSAPATATSLACKLDIPKIAGLEDGRLTVGREFFITCEGMIPKEIKIEKLHFNLDPKASIYQLKLLSFEFRNSSTADLRVTSYMTGTHTFQKLILTDDHLELDLGPQQIPVYSVLSEGEKAKLYGPLGPLELKIPPIYYVGLGLVIFMFFLLIAIRIWFWRQKKARLEELRSYETTPLSPSQQAFQKVRKLKREYVFYHGGYQGSRAQDNQITEEQLQKVMAEIDQIFRLYLLRKFQIPGMSWSEVKFARAIKKKLKALGKHSLTPEDLQLMERILLEIKLLRHSKLRTKDLIQLTEQSQKWIDICEKGLI